MDAMNILDTIGQATIDKVQSERPVPRFEPGDTVRVHVKVQEGNRERLQVYEGLCIGRKNAGVNSSFTFTACRLAHRSGRRRRVISCRCRIRHSATLP